MALKLWLTQHRDVQLAEALIDPGRSAYSGKSRDSIRNLERDGRASLRRLSDQVKESSGGAMIQV
jgi:hypothetical protein